MANYIACCNCIGPPGNCPCMQAGKYQTQLLREIEQAIKKEHEEYLKTFKPNIDDQGGEHY